MTAHETEFKESVAEEYEPGLPSLSVPQTDRFLVPASSNVGLCTTDQQPPKQALVHLDAFSDLLARRHGLFTNAALAINLAALSAALGSARTIKNPLGGTLSASINAIVEDTTGADVRRAMNQALGPVLRKVTKKIADHQLRGAKDSRQLRIELEAECLLAMRHLHSPQEKPREPLTVPVPQEERQKQALDDATREAEQVAERMRLYEFEEKPFLITDGLTARDLVDLRQHAFDGAILNFCPDGQALRGLESLRPNDRTRVLRFLRAGWHGGPFLAGADTLVSPVATNLWLLEPGDTVAAWHRPVFAAAGLLETFIVVANDADLAPDPAALEDATVDKQWETLLAVLLGERILGDAQEHTLSTPATARFSDFHRRTRCEAAPETRKLRAWWPEQALKIALLLHISAGENVPEEIDADTVGRAIGLVEGFGVEQVRAFDTGAADQQEFEVEMELMVAKIRLHGPLPKRELFRRYHVQSYDQLEPVLARCCERKLVQIEDGLVCPVLTGQ